MKHIIAEKSNLSAEATLAKILETIEAKGLKVFTTIKHGEAAAKNGLDLRDTNLIIFGNPQVGTALMQADQLMGLELPMKILVWQDADGGVFAGFRDPEKYLDEYNLDAGREVVSKVKTVMTALIKSANQ